jgi:hypothetical protein
MVCSSDNDWEMLVNKRTLAAIAGVAGLLGGLGLTTAATAHPAPQSWIELSVVTSGSQYFKPTSELYSVDESGKWQYVGQELESHKKAKKLHGQISPAEFDQLRDNVNSDELAREASRNHPDGAELNCDGYGYANYKLSVSPNVNKQMELSFTTCTGLLPDRKNSEIASDIMWQLYSLVWHD